MTKEIAQLEPEDFTILVDEDQENDHWLNTMLQELAPLIEEPPHVHVVDWADNNFRLSKGTQGASARWRTRPEQKAILHHMSADSDCELVVIPKSSQVGATTMALIISAKSLVDGNSCALWEPTLADRDSVSQTVVNAMFQQNPVMANLLDGSIDTGNKSNKMAMKVMKSGAVWHILPAGSPTHFRRLTISNGAPVIGDEYSAWAADIGGAGAGLVLMQGRQLSLIHI